MAKRTQSSCSCETCQSYCTYKPGWFKRGEAEKAATLLGMTLKDFFNKYLRVDFVVGNTYYEKGDTFFVLSPGVKGCETGKEASFNPTGECVFYKEGKCQIHAAKPWECLQAWHEEPSSGVPKKQAAETWREHQADFQELMGREPVFKEPELAELLQFSLDMLR